MIEGEGRPLYRQIEEDVRARIARGDVPPGTQLETEQDLMSRFEVSRATVRQALQDLIAQGVLEVRRGRGTFVRARPVEHRLRGFYTFRRQIQSQGMTPGTRVRYVRVERADEWLAQALAIGPGTPVVVLSRLRLADDEPLVAETSYLPSSRFPGLERYDFVRLSLYETLTAHYGTRPVRACEVFEPILMSADDARVLDSVQGSPALRVDRTAFDADGARVEFCRSTVRGDRYRYSVELRET